MKRRMNAIDIFRLKTITKSYYKKMKFAFSKIFYILFGVSLEYIKRDKQIPKYMNQCNINSSHNVVVHATMSVEAIIKVR